MLENPDDCVVGVMFACELTFREDVRTGMCSFISSRRWFRRATLAMVRDRGNGLSIDEELDGREGCDSSLRG